MALAIFDLDNTLLNGDSDHEWGQFLIKTGAVNPATYKEANDRFYIDYKNGCLNVQEYLRFVLKPFTEKSVEQLLHWRKEFFESLIKPMILPAGEELIASHKAKGDDLLIITATNHFVTQPIADYLGIQHLIATIPEMKEGKYTGYITGIPSFREGKITRLDEWLLKYRKGLEGATFYSDSHNDLPLLRKIDHPVAVDPDPVLRSEAESKDWKIISLRASPLPSNQSSKK